MRLLLFCICVVSCISSLNLNAQPVKTDIPKVKGKAKERALPPKVFAFLGHSEYTGGFISKSDFDKHLKEGLTAKDSSGNFYKVNGFMFSYGERNLYEDSMGNLMVLTDFLTEWCEGDSITSAIRNNIFYKTKPGDTAYIDQIRVLLPQGDEVSAKGMRFVLTK